MGYVYRIAFWFALLFKEGNCLESSLSPAGNPFLARSNCKTNMQPSYSPQLPQTGATWPYTPAGVNFILPTLLLVISYPEKSAPHAQHAGVALRFPENFYGDLCGILTTIRLLFGPPCPNVNYLDTPLTHLEFLWVSS